MIVPIFLPNRGCPFLCIYCQQEKITSQTVSFPEADLIRTRLDQAVQAPGFRPDREPEIAFYGGTFTNLPEVEMIALLEAARPYITQCFFKSIRVSTRPDTLDPDKLELLRRYTVRTVELGVQSLQDPVLRLSRRGYQAAQVGAAVKQLKKSGFKVGIQLMVGLPGDSEKGFLNTIQQVIELQPNMVRLYPTLVLQGTELAEWHAQKRYQALELEQAVKLCTEAVKQLEAHNIPVIRIGLMSSPALLQPGQILAGPWHTCFGFLVRSALYHQIIATQLPQPGFYSVFSLRVAQNEVPLIRGYKNQGLRWIEEKTGSKVAAVIGDKSLAKGQIKVTTL